MSTTYTDESATTTQKKTRGITLHVTETFYQRCKEQAGETPLGEWARGALEAHLTRGACEHRLMAEVWALRYVLLNGVLHVVSEADRADVLQHLMTFSDEADRRKADKARALLDGTA